LKIVAPTTTPDGKPLPYTAAWHHQHLYAPRSITPDSNMPAFRFLYQKRRINGEASPDSLNFAGNANDRPATPIKTVKIRHLRMFMKVMRLAISSRSVLIK